MNAAIKDAELLDKIAIARQHLASGEPKEALDVGLSLIQQRPEHFDVWKVMGASLADLGQTAPAVEAFTTASQLNADDYDTHKVLGVLFRDQNKISESLESFQRAIKLCPDKVDAVRGHHQTVLRLGQLETDDLKKKSRKVIDFLVQAISTNPNLVDYYYSLSHVYQLLGMAAESHTVMKQVHELVPDCNVVRYNLGVTYKAIGDVDTALKYFESIDHEDFAFMGKVKHSQAHCLLMKRVFGKGWDVYENRWDDIQFPSTPLETSLPVWDGSSDKRVLVWLEQGLGDQIMFASMLEDVAERCRSLTLYSDERLVPVFSRSFGHKVEVQSCEEDLHASSFDAHIPIGSLGKFVRRDADSFTNRRKGYLRPDDKVVNVIRTNLKKSFGDKEIIGISWFSNSPTHHRLVRNIDLSKLLNGFASRDAIFVCLQYGDVEADMRGAQLKTGISVFNPVDIDQFHDVDNLSNLICACDRVVSIDNATVHLAAAHGIPTKVLLPTDVDWRWGTSGPESYWYPSLELVRQEEPGKWVSENF